jgi:polyisoprenoid-binding protein YceI
MKTTRPLITVACIAALILAGCDKPPKGDDAKITEKEQPVASTGTEYTVDTAASWVKFTGHGVGKNHPATLKLLNGKVAVMNDTVSGGSFTIDIKSMKMEQKGKDIEGKLRPHLLSGDFFDAEKFGTSKFEVTNIVPYAPKDGEKSLVEGANFLVSGNLTLKDETKNISFPVRVDQDGQTLKAKANFDIDRTQWKINYGNDKTLGDKFISEEVNIELYIEARKIDGAI